MQLIVIEHAGQPVDSDRRTAVVFRPPGGTIGRDIDNHLVLRDDSRQISRLQALLQVGETSCSLKNLSSVSTIEVNRMSIGYAQVQHLQIGDTIRIGPYLLRAESDGNAGSSAWKPPERPLPPPHTAGAASKADGPRHDSLAPPVSAPVRLHDLNTLSTDPLELFTASQAQGVDTLALPASGRAPAPAAAAQHSSPAMPSGTHSDYAPATPPDRVPEWAAPFRLQPAPAVLPDDGQSQAAAASDSTPERADRGRPRVPAASSETVAPDVLLRSFFEGAGLDVSTPATHWSAEQLYVAGQLLALFANGTVELLSSRSILKREVRADMTMLLDRENNPLKLLPDGGAALRQMFGLPFPGFMSPQSAVSDAFQDLHAHQIGMVAGMRAALMDLLARFSPQRLRERDAEPRWYEQKLPMLYKARLWDRYAALHRDVVVAVEDDFASVFGKSFLKAYDAEVESYRGRRRG